MKHAAAQPSRKKLALFQQAAEALQQAARTAKSHRHGGESDRLLRIASDVARSAARDGASQDLQSMAFDVAACINAARRVTGDAEPAPRSRLLAEAAQALSRISEKPVDEIVWPLATLADRAVDPLHSQWRELARQANYEAHQLARALMQQVELQDTERHIVAHGLAARISQLTEIVFVAAALHGEHRDGWGSQTLLDLRGLFHGGMGRLN